MEKSILLGNLYDYYRSLLTEKQKQYFEDYYFDNLTLSEISENYGVSRNAIHHLLKNAEEKLLSLEEKLQLYKKSIEIKKIIYYLDDSIKTQIEQWL